MLLMCKGIDELLSFLVFFDEKNIKEKREKKQRITIGVFGCYFFFRLFVTTSVNASMQLQPRREKTTLEGYVCKSEYSRKISI